MAARKSQPLASRWVDTSRKDLLTFPHVEKLIIREAARAGLKLWECQLPAAQLRFFQLAIVSTLGRGHGWASLSVPEVLNEIQ